MTEPSERPGVYHDIRDDYDDEFGRGQSPREVARRRLFGPAVAFVVIGVVCVLGALVGIVAVVNDFMSTLPGPAHGPQTVLFLGLLFLGACLFLLVICGGICLVSLRRYRLCLVSAYIVTGLSLAGPYGILFFPFGIWALILLYRPDVREEFRRPAPVDD
ncbi:MAG: hypothetical protein J2P46_00355 [Zavarzinella sp.]|nr:hypothetical protein [Zavarzinella sp.]